MASKWEPVLCWPALQPPRPAAFKDQQHSSATQPAGFASPSRSHSQDGSSSEWHQRGKKRLESQSLCHWLGLHWFLVYFCERRVWSWLSIWPITSHPTGLCSSPWNWRDLFEMPFRVASTLSVARVGRHVSGRCTVLPKVSGYGRMVFPYREDWNFSARIKKIVWGIKNELERKEA